MPNFTQALKAEIVRLSRREISVAVSPLKKSNFALKKTVWELKKKLSALESDNKRLLASQKQPQVPKEEIEKARITSKNVRGLRTKLGLSQDSFAKLLGVTSQAVYAMEHKEGKRLRLRPATLANLLSVRKMGKREAQRILEEIEKKQN